ncbi:hypothetical protein R1sor_001664 [Riccia sorocarpa]|uniref:RING-type domain-containing protein n=1 Tax=Riccia sorocarpa TaxID=122646 RepID=A0ABD3GWK4_9MARC
MPPRPKMKARKRGVSPPIDLEVDESFLDRFVDGFEDVAMKRADQDKEAAENQQQIKRACGIRSKRQPVSKDVAGPSGVVSGGAIVPHTAIPGAIVPFREPRGVSDVGQSGGPAVRFSELSVLSLKEITPYLDFTRLKEEGIVHISGKLFSGMDNYDLDISASGLRRSFTFPVMDECTVVVSAVEVEKSFKEMFGKSRMKDAFDTIKSPHLRPDWHEWLSAELKAKLLAYLKTDRGSQAKFREGWTAIVEIMKSNFLAAEAHAGSTDSAPLLLEACSSFGDFQAKWDAKKGQLVRETEKLKTELTKAQGEAEKSRMETVALKEEASVGSVAGSGGSATEPTEALLLSQTLCNRASVGSAALMRLCSIAYGGSVADSGPSATEPPWPLLLSGGSATEPTEALLLSTEALFQQSLQNVQRQLPDIRQMLQETVTKASSVGAPEASNQVLQLQQQLQVKEQELVSIKSAEEKVLKRLKTAKKNVTKLEMALKDMPSGVMVRSDVEAARRLKSGAKLEISQYPPVYVVAESYNVKAKEKPVICTFCRGFISPGLDLRVPLCGHPYHFLVCWRDGCQAVVPVTWVQEFSLNKEINVESLQERLAAAEDTRTMDASKLGFDDGDMEVTGVLAMQAKKKSYSRNLSDA